MSFYLFIKLSTHQEQNIAIATRGLNIAENKINASLYAPSLLAADLQEQHNTIKLNILKESCSKGIRFCDTLK